MEKSGAFTTIEMRNAASQWNLGCDQGLLLYLQDFSQKLLSRYHSIRQKVETLEEETGKTITQVGNLSTGFLMLSNTQFIESRIYDDDIRSSRPLPEETTVKDVKVEEDAVIKVVNAALKAGLAVVSEAYEVIELQGGDNEGDDTSLTAVLKTRNPYEDRRLPNMIGSPLFNLNESFILGFNNVRTKPPDKTGKNWLDNEEYSNINRVQPGPQHQEMNHEEEEPESDDEWLSNKEPGDHIDEVLSNRGGIDIDEESSDEELSNQIRAEIDEASSIEEIPNSATAEAISQPNQARGGDISQDLFASEHEDYLSRKVPTGGVSMLGPGFVPANLPTNKKPSVSSLFDDLEGSDDIFSVLDERKSNLNNKNEVVSEDEASESTTAKENKDSTDLFGGSDTEDLFSSSSSLTSKSSGLSGDIFTNQRVDKNAVKSKSLDPVQDLFSDEVDPDIFSVSKPHAVEKPQTRHDDIFKDMFDDDDGPDDIFSIPKQLVPTKIQKRVSPKRDLFDEEEDYDIFTTGKQKGHDSKPTKESSSKSDTSPVRARIEGAGTSKVEKKEIPNKIHSTTDPLSMPIPAVTREKDLSTCVQDEKDARKVSSIKSNESRVNPSLKSVFPATVISELKGQIPRNDPTPEQGTASKDGVSFEDEPSSNSNLLPALTKKRAALPNRRLPSRKKKVEEEKPVVHQTAEFDDEDLEDIFASGPPPLLAEKPPLEDDDGMDSSMVFDDDFDIFSNSRKPLFRQSHKDSLFDDDDVEDIFK